MRRRALGGGLATLGLAFVIVLAVPDHDRALALYAFLLLAGALALAALIAALAGAPASDERRLAGAQRLVDRRPPDLESIESDVRATFAAGTVDEALLARIRAIATAHLDHDHGLRVEHDAQSIRALLGEGPLWGILEASAARRHVRVDARTLTDIVDQLERL